MRDYDYEMDFLSNRSKTKAGTFKIYTSKKSNCTKGKTLGKTKLLKCDFKK